MNDVKTRGFASISTPDGRFRIWVPRPTNSGRMTCNVGFPLKEHLDFVDAIDGLEYLQVDEVRQIDKDLSTMVLWCKQSPTACMERLLEDLPELMEQYLVNRTEDNLEEIGRRNG